MISQTPHTKSPVTLSAVEKSQSLVPQLRFVEFEGEWKKKKLGEVSIFHDSKRIPLSQDERKNRKGEFPYYGASGIIDHVDDYIFDGEFILLGEDGANILMRNSPLAFLAKGKFWVNNHAHVIEAKGSNMFLSESLERLRYDKYNTGTAQPKLNAEVCKGILIHLPTLPEQQKIASFLSVVDTKLQQLTQKKELLEQYKKGVMQQLFSQQLRFKPDAIERNPNSNRDDAVISYPDWEFPHANILFKSISDKNHKRDLPILAITQEFGAIPRELIDYYITVESKSVDGYKVVQKGDFIISLRSFQGGIEYSNYNGICSPAYNILRPTSDEIVHGFYKRYFKTEYYIRQLQRRLEGIRDGKMISYKYFSEIKLPFPSKEEQRNISNYLSALDAKIERVAQQITQTQLFKKGLLQQLFV